MASPQADVSPQPAEGPLSLENFGYRQELRRELRFVDMLAYGLVFMVPIAPFAIFGSVFQVSGGMVALTYLVALVAMLFTANSYAQMVRAFPMAGSVYNYASRGIAPPVGFVAGWAILLDYILVPSLLYVVAAFSMNAIVTAIPTWLWLIVFVAVNTAVNYLGIKITATVTRWFLLAELAVLALVVVVFLIALGQGKGNGLSAGTALFNGDLFGWSLIFAAVGVAMLSFLGFDGISMLAEENREEAQKIGRAMAGALIVAGALFVLQTWLGSMLVPNPDGLLQGGAVVGDEFAQAAETASGHWMYVLTSLATALAWGIANAMVAQGATSRLLFAMARDKQLPAFLARVSPRHAVPTNAVFLVAGLSLVLGLTLWFTREADAITDLGRLVNFGALVAFIVLHVTVFWWYVVRNGSRDWARHAILPALGLGMLIFVVINQKIFAQLIGGIWVLIGVVVVAFLVATKRTPVLAGMSEETTVDPDDNVPAAP
ncbi:APC family permease [Asanoa iriomotensis]|uniref:Porin n=1 Tax=Asanoa iriomotensis TaxID=234613 RepID=A0ABQ4CGK1_9ACTN|nr:porin [Asanoa iriomotensis]